MTIQLTECMNHAAQNNPNITSIMAEMIATMENDAKLKKEILFKVDEINMEIFRKDKLCYDVVNATRNNGDYYKAKVLWKQFRNEVELALGELYKRIQWTRYPDEWSETYELLKRRAALHDDEVERLEWQELLNV
ncbi:hypothetical protein BK120_27195 [Paenibacillus sp. FSL A5-0031]|uniref:hypothetical protein n=1 Tax=Paenibacillus sp. FSL A5-0031 TaxID=1920420 RepID=UPI0009701896|nr:hypothetical protein [Paenibacillus sp. FSL A5-0031]OME77214.1 hypothetical protein BK120_27195 [Paenibacillus sp. FSL A5-0031]